MNKLAVITGGTKGIGEALVKKFASQGFDVASCSRNEGDLMKLKNEIESEFAVQLYYKKADLSKREDVNAFVNEVIALQRNVDVLINNTGVFIPGSIHEEDEGALELMINTNLYSAYHLTRAFIGNMKKARHGHVFNVCSTASITPYVNGGSYCISKYAMYGMTKVLREEMKEYGVRVTAILPGATLTASWHGVEIPEERFMPPEDIADLVHNAYQISDRTVVEDLLVRPQLGDI